MLVINNINEAQDEASDILNRAKYYNDRDWDRIEHFLVQLSFLDLQSSYDSYYDDGYESGREYETDQIRETIDCALDHIRIFKEELKEEYPDYQTNDLDAAERVLDNYY